MVVNCPSHVRMMGRLERWCKAVLGYTSTPGPPSGSRTRAGSLIDGGIGQVPHAAEVLAWNLFGGYMVGEHQPRSAQKQSALEQQRDCEESERGLS